MIDDCDKMYLTKIDASDPEADAYFPKWNEEDFDVTVLDQHEENQIRYKHLEYVRKKV